VFCSFVSSIRLGNDEFNLKIKSLTSTNNSSINNIGGRRQQKINQNSTFVAVTPPFGSS